MSEEKKKCPGCAEMIPADASMCEYCGEKFNTSAQMEPAAENPELYAPQTAAKWSLLFTPVFGAYVLIEASAGECRWSFGTYKTAGLEKKKFRW